VLFAVLALVPAGAQLAELMNKITLAFKLRRHPEAFTQALVASLCIVGTQAIF
jgi:hypothetical protein